MVVSYSGLSYQYRLAPPAKKVVIKEIFVFKFSIDPVAVGRGQFFRSIHRLRLATRCQQKFQQQMRPPQQGDNRLPRPCLNCGQFGQNLPIVASPRGECEVLTS